MLNSILKRLSGKRTNTDMVQPETVVDLSRAVPGYKPPPETQTEPLVEPSIAEDTIAQTVPRSDDALAEAALEALSDKHDAWAQNDLADLSQAWEIARQNGDLRGHLQAVTRAAHNLKGMATTYGHPAITRLAASLCHLLKAEHAASQHALINLHIEACRAAYLEGGTGEGSDMIAQSVCVALETQVKRTLQA